MNNYRLRLAFVPLLFIFFSCNNSNSPEWNGRAKTAKEIQSLIDQLPEEGGDVKLPEGTYSIDQPIHLRSNVWLHGAGRGTILSVSNNIEGIVLDSLKGAKVSDLAVISANRQKAEAGIILDDCGDCQVFNVLTQGFKKYGIWLRNNSFLCELKSCKSADNGQANFYFDNLTKGRGGDYVPNIATSCISYGGKYGFEFNKAIVANLTGSVVYQSLDDAYYIHSHSNSVNISGSRSYQAGSEAVYVKDSHEVNLSSNIFCWHRGHGIILDNAKWGTISSNNIIDNGIRTRDGSLRNGIVLKNKTKGVHVSSNAIFNWGDQAPMEYGIIEDRSSTHNIIANNNINYYTQKGIYSQGDGTLVTDNLMKGDSAYVGMKREKLYPDFDTLRIHKFMINN